jgi:hypothetical protein
VKPTLTLFPAARPREVDPESHNEADVDSVSSSTSEGSGHLTNPPVDNTVNSQEAWDPPTEGLGLQMSVMITVVCENDTNSGRETARRRDCREAHCIH